MVITEGQVAQAASELRGRRGGVDNDYFGLLFLEKEFRLSRDEAAEQIAYGGNDFGIDGYHVDRQARNFHLLQFKFSKSVDQFIGSMQRLLSAGLARVFDTKSQQAENPILRDIRSKLYQLRNVIHSVYLEFIFVGDPDKAQENEALQKLREDLQSRSYLTQTYFGRAVPIIVRFRSKLKRGREEMYVPLSFDLNMSGDLSYVAPESQTMHIGFVRLRELHAMFVAMKERFLDRNIRSLLAGRKPGVDTAVNRRLLKAFEGRGLRTGAEARPGRVAGPDAGVPARLPRRDREVRRTRCAVFGRRADGLLRLAASARHLRRSSSPERRSRIFLRLIITASHSSRK